MRRVRTATAIAALTTACHCVRRTGSRSWRRRGWLSPTMPESSGSSRTFPMPAMSLVTLVPTGE